MTSKSKALQLYKNKSAIVKKAVVENVELPAMYDIIEMAVSDSAISVRKAAAYALYGRDDVPFSIIKTMLEDFSKDVQEAAIRIVATNKASYIPLIIEYANRTNVTERVTAMKMMKGEKKMNLDADYDENPEILAPADDFILAMLLKGLQDPDECVQNVASDTAGDYALPFSFLKEMYASPRSYIRNKALQRCENSTDVPLDFIKTLHDTDTLAHAILACKGCPNIPYDYADMLVQEAKAKKEDYGESNTSPLTRVFWALNLDVFPIDYFLPYLLGEVKPTIRGEHGWTTAIISYLKYKKLPYSYFTKLIYDSVDDTGMSCAIELLKKQKPPKGENKVSLEEKDIEYLFSKYADVYGLVAYLTNYDNDRPITVAYMDAILKNESAIKTSSTWHSMTVMMPLIKEKLTLADVARWFVVALESRGPGEKHSEARFSVAMDLVNMACALLQQVPASVRDYLMAHDDIDVSDYSYLKDAVCPDTKGAGEWTTKELEAWLLDENSRGRREDVEQALAARDDVSDDFIVKALKSSNWSVKDSGNVILRSVLARDEV